MTKREKILNHINATFMKNFVNEADHIVISTKLNKLLGRPNIIHNFTVIENTKMKELTFFFIKGATYRIPEQVHSIIDRDLTYEIIRVDRVVHQLESTVDYNTTIRPGTSYSDIAFCIAEIVKGLHDKGLCDANAMFTMINEYFK